MSDFTELAGRYIATWNETDPSARRAMVEETFPSSGRYVDPLADVTGHDQIDAFIAAAQAQFSGLTFRLAGTVDAHHDQARFTWELGPYGDGGADGAAGADGAEAVVVGFDVAQRDADGRLALVLGFLDKVPSA
jgi:SnoaL-like domain